MSDEDILDRARQIQRSVADGTTVSVKLSTLQDMIAEIERLRALVTAHLADDQITPASTPFLELAGRVQAANASDQNRRGK